MAFGDIRVADRADWLIERIASTGCVTLRKLGGDLAGERAAGRFLSSPHVSVDGIVETLSSRTAEQCAGRRVLVVQDTTEINFSRRDGKRHGFGPGGDGKTPGFFIHPAIAVDVESEAVIGLADATVWTRGKGRNGAHGNRRFAEKESERWLMSCRAAAGVLRASAAVTMVADRESDLYPLFAERPRTLDLIVRAAQNRSLADGGLLFDALNEAEVLGRVEVRVAPRGPGDRARIAVVALRAAKVLIARPQAYRKKVPAENIALTLVEAREVNAPTGKAPLLWRLLTTHVAENAVQANLIVQLYRLRWRIEQTFRALKGEGLGLEHSQVTEAVRMFNLAVMALAGAIRTIQLVDARDGSPRPSSDVVDDQLRPALIQISKTLEGGTQRQKNPHPPSSLAFIAWIAARLGGWNCYYKPPGPKTMHNGWNELAIMLAGYTIAVQSKNP
jgi:hypothetical protein